MDGAWQEAEAAKNRGNAHFQQQLYVAAVSEYTAAISMSRQRGFAHPAMAAIYYSNRAAAHMKLDRHEVQALALAALVAVTLRPPALCCSPMLPCSPPPPPPPPPSALPCCRPSAVHAK